MRSMPLMPEIASSIGSTTSRSTMSGDAPGYGTATTTTGASISGYSSVSSCVSATMPNTTNISIATTVRTGLVMAVSEIYMSAPTQLNRSTRRDALRRPPQQRVVGGQPRGHHHTLGARVAKAERDVHALGLPVGHAQHPGGLRGRIDGVHRHDETAGGLRHHAALGKKAGDQPPADVRDGDEDRHLASGRIGLRRNPLDAPRERLIVAPH